ncbi:hypothetical protein D9758_007782 [Tetrapyrgos nigripes]|uniref:Uncharacterized protein n=1 Tax=Tetrapyrgos nigripes TaxID=182062 RepID=A0A8H5CZZ4_9AGAR|nr:hypothetical protein D9758_007782 [Tetrapyrgos nigripes]
MSSLPDSPKRPVKTKYTRKKKRAKDAESDMNASGSSDHEEETDTKKVVAEGKRLSDMRPPDSTTCKNDAVKPSSASPKSPSESSSIKRDKVKQASPVTSKQDAGAMSPPSSSRKPPSVRAAKPISSVTQSAPCSLSLSIRIVLTFVYWYGRNMNPSESEIDDGASVADSVMTTTRVRRTEPERIAYFKNQPECDRDSLEPHRVKCLRCQKTISLGTKQTYVVRPWELHRARCDQKVPSSVMLNKTASPSVSAAEEAPSSPKSAPGRARTNKTEAERKEFFLSDPRALEVREDEAQCKRCQKWIRLSNTHRYGLANWLTHQDRCSDAVPSSRVATAERKLKIVNDPRAKKFGPRHVVCASCGTTVALQGGDYNLTNWEQHKTECMDGSGPSSGDNASSTTSQTARPPPSIESTSTVVDQEGSMPRGTKRRLEEDDVTPEDPDAHVDVRPRTEAYVTPEKEPPSGLGWFLVPFKSALESFVEGFKGGLSKT